MSAMEHLVPEKIFSTETERAQGISAVKALSIGSQQGQKIYTIDRSNVDVALSKVNLGADAENDIRNAVNAGKFATAHENRINFNGWVGEGYILMDMKTGAGAYMISGGGNGSETKPATDLDFTGFLPYLEIILDTFADFTSGIARVLVKITAKLSGIVDTMLSIVEISKNCSFGEGMILLLQYTLFSVLWGGLAAGFIGFFAIFWLMPVIILAIGALISSFMLSLDIKTCKGDL